MERGALAEQPEPALDLVQPGGGVRDEVQVDTRSLGDLGAHLRVLVRGVVVAHNVQVKALGGLPVDQAQGGQPHLGGGAAWAAARITLPVATSRAANSVVVPWRR